jgi:hypothetical protein
MSYCRWSSNGMKCDVYVYEDVSGGFTCHVAARKIVNLHEAPHCPSLWDYQSCKDGKTSDEDMADFMAKYRAWMTWLDTNAIRENIELEYDGETFNTDTATDMGNQLKMLQNMGYQVPDYAIESLWEEGKENGEQEEI